MLVRADGDARHGGVALKELRERKLAADAGEHADHADHSPHRQSPHRLGHGARPAHLDDQIHPATADLRGRAPPLRLLAVVQNLVGAQRAQTLHLGRAGTRRDHPAA